MRAPRWTPAQRVPGVPRIACPKRADTCARNSRCAAALVRTRTRYIALAKALVRRDGLRVPTSASAWVPTRIAELELSPTWTTELSPLFAVFAPLNAQIAVADARIAAFVKEDSIATRLTTAPGVGPVTASAFVATIDDISRFRTAHELEAYLGVIPSERSSGEKRQLGRRNRRPCASCHQKGTMKGAFALGCKRAPALPLSRNGHAAHGRLH